MNKQLVERVKQHATEKVYSHGAFGESERYYNINTDKLIQAVVEECCQAVELSKDPDSIYFVTRETAIDAIRTHFGVHTG